MINFQYLKYILMAIPIVMILCAVIIIVGQGTKNVLKLIKKGSRALKRWIIPILILAIVFGGVSWLVEQMQAATQASAIIGFHYPEASLGLNPNGTRFNVSEILSDDILEQAISEGKLNDVSVEDLKRCFRVTPMNAGDTISTDQVYMSTEYQLTYEANKETRHLKPADVVESVTQVYCREFVNAYSRKTNVLTMDFSELENKDYLDIVELLDRKAEDISDYAVSMMAVAPAFQSETTGETFSSIDEKVKSFREVQLERFQAFILTNGLAKNVDQYVAKLNYDNTVTHEQYLKDVATHRINLDAIDRYERDMARIVLIPSEDVDGEFYMSRTKIGVDYFAENAEVVMQDAAKRQRDMQFNDYAIAQMLAAGDVSSQIVQAEEMLESIKSEYQTFSKLLMDTLADYNKKTANDYVNVITGQPASMEVEIAKAAILAIIFAVAFSILIVAVKGRRANVSYAAYGDAGRRRERNNREREEVEKDKREETVKEEIKR